MEAKVVATLGERARNEPWQARRIVRRFLATVEFVGGSPTSSAAHEQSLTSHMTDSVQPSTITVYCGSSPGHQPAYSEAARALGIAMAERGLALVYGGGKVGLMGVIADAVLEAGGRVVGVMPRHLVDREIAHGSLTELHVVESMHERKQRMVELGDAFVLMPGGFGSWDEFCEAVTWSQLGLHRKACGILNVLDYYAPFLSMTDHAVAQGFVRRTHRDMIVIESDPGALLGRLFEPRAAVESKWSKA